MGYLASLLSRTKTDVATHRTRVRHSGTWALSFALLLGSSLIGFPTVCVWAEVSAPTLLAADSDQTVEVAAHESRDFVIQAAPNRPLRLSLVQGEHFLTMTIHGPGIKGATRTNDAGLGAAITSILMSPVGESREYHVTIESYHKDEASEGRLRVEALSLNTDDAKRKAEAEDLFYDAEFLRRNKNAKEWPRAREEFEAALVIARALVDAPLEQRILTEESRLLLFRLNEYLEAHETAAKAVALSASQDSGFAPGMIDHSVLAAEALAVKTLGSTDYYLADYSSAIEHSTQALEIYRALKDRYWEGVLLGNLAYVYLESGDSSNALRTAEQALSAADQLHDQFGRIFTLEALGSIHSARGELDQAYASYQQALGALQQTPYPAVEAGVWRGLGRFYKDVGKTDAAEDAYEHAVKTAHYASDSSALLEATSEMADLERSQGKLKAAHSAYASALTVAVGASLPREGVLLKAGLARTLGAEGQAFEATRQAREAMAQATSIGFIEGEAAAALVLADLELSRGHRVAAREAYGRAESVLTEANERTQAAYAIARMARIDADLGKLEVAERESGEALLLIERTRRMVPGRELRTSYFANQQNVYTLSIQLMLRLDHVQPGHGYAARAFEIAEMARARSLTDEAGSGSSPGAGASAQAVACEQRLSAAYHRLPDLYLTSDNASYRIVQTRQQIQSLLAECDALESLDRRTGPDGATPLATVAQVQRSMESHSASLLEFWLGDTESVAWYVSGTRFHMAHLPPRREVEKIVQATNQAILSRQEQVAGEDVAARLGRIHLADERASVLLGQLGTMLLGPLAGRQEKLLYVVPDGKLASLPFPALTVSSTKTALIEQAEIVEEPSSSLLLQLLRREAMRGESDRSASGRVVVFADPVYSESDERLRKPHAGLTHVSQVSSPGFLQLDRLTASSTEAAFIGRLSGVANSDLHIGTDSSAKLMLATEWGDYRVMHLAVHALLGASPAFTGIAFTMVDAEGHHEDGMLWLNQIYRLHGAPEMVFLSGCQTAEGKNVPGEGISSLANAFLYVGARSVIGSLWSIEDDASSELVQDFYSDLLRRHLSPGVSLRRAQLALAKNPRYRSPYYWAAFQLEGLSGSTPHAAR